MNARLVIVEGLPGSGKSTLSRAVARQLALNGVPVAHVPESARPHPTNVVRLPHDPPTWATLDPGSVAAQSVRRWRSFVGTLPERSTVQVLDGHLLHWDFSALLLGDADPALLRRYAHDVFSLLGRVDPAVVHLRPRDPRAALRRTAALRGESWLRRQLATKVESPYARRKGYEGLDGWLALGRDLQAWSDELLADAPLRTLRLDPTAGRWGPRHRRAVEFTGARPRLDWRFQAVLWKRSLAERASRAAWALRGGVP